MTDFLPTSSLYIKKVLTLTQTLTDILLYATVFVEHKDDAQYSV